MQPRKFAVDEAARFVAAAASRSEPPSVRHEASRFVYDVHCTYGFKSGLHSTTWLRFDTITTVRCTPLASGRKSTRPVTSTHCLGWTCVMLSLAIMGMLI